MNGPKVLKVGIGNDRGYPRSDMALRVKGQRSRLGLKLGLRLGTAIRHSLNSIISAF